MKIVIAPNAFKECLSAPEAAQAILEGVVTAAPHAQCCLIPLADGGDGTVDALVSACQGEFITVTVHDPLMRPVVARYGLIDTGKTAVIEMAEASGLRLLAEQEKNPLHTTTFGTGELLLDALKHGVNQIIIGIGGSATTDLGIGMAAALGYSFLDASGNILPPIGKSLQCIQKINHSNVVPLIDTANIMVACDVKNPLLGEQGAAPVFGPQKGATPAMVNQLQDGLQNTAGCIERDLSIRIHEIPGGGAAGGLGAGLMAFCGAKIQSGFEIIAGITKLESAIKNADLVITGEGKIDHSTSFGKVPHGVAMMAKKYHVPVVALTGKSGSGIEALYENGMTAVFSIQDGPLSIEDSLIQAKSLLKNTAYQVTKLWQAKN